MVSSQYSFQKEKWKSSNVCYINLVQWEAVIVENNQFNRIIFLICMDVYGLLIKKYVTKI